MSVAIGLLIGLVCMSAVSAQTPGWRIQWTETPIPVGPTVMCGDRTCHSIGTYRRNSVIDPERRTIWIVKGAPPAILFWELCNADRYDRTGELADKGCERDRGGVGVPGPQ